jgi:phage gp36-like protein
MDRYIHPGDYTMQIRKEIKDFLGGSDEVKLIVAETAAVGEMKSYLKKRYDINQIFFLMKKHDAALAWTTGSIVYYKANSDADEKYQVWEAIADVAANGPLPGADVSKWAPFAKRNPFINMYLVDITLYHLHSPNAQRTMPETRETRYADALAWLRMVGKGEIDADLPQLPTTDVNYNPDIRFNSHPLENQRW